MKMSRFELRIELLSDMCVSDGGVYNSSIDIDICYDRQGFPYIPAKRIRGCLRECAIELRDWGLTMEEIPWEKMFGQADASEKRAAVRISDAHLDGFEEMQKLVRENDGHIVFHPQNILGHFTYIRTQTSIDQNTGAADKTSLRTMRVADKGLVFIAGVDMDLAYREALEKCCAVFRHIGVSRTRGLGEINVLLLGEAGNENKKAVMKGEQREIELPHAVYEEGTEILEYQFQLEEPVICKSVNGEEGKTLDYIEGSKILGVLIENADIRKEFLDLVSSAELFCSNAYISESGIRYTEVPAYIFSVKNDDSHYVNKLYAEPVAVKENGLQLNRMKHCYVYVDEEQKLYRKSVKTEERYHHSRPEDKSIGRAAAKGGGNSQFYQMSSIEAGQAFQGFIAGTVEQIKAVYDILAKKTEYYIGYARSSEYGKVRLRITGVKKKPEPQIQKVKAFCVKLDAPAIVYNKNAFYSTDADDLIEEINAVLGIPQDKLDLQSGIKRHIRYTTLGGYNTTWNCPKPVIAAFDKGTSIFYTLKEETALSIPPILLIGERVQEGFGEAAVQIIDRIEGTGDLLEFSEERSKQENKNVNAEGSSFTNELCQDLFRNYVRMMAAHGAKESGLRLETRATVRNMLLMCQESESFDKVKLVCDDRYGKNTEDKAKKLEYASRILSAAERGASTVLKEFCCKYQIENFQMEADEVKMLYLMSYLEQLKYNFRSQE